MSVTATKPRTPAPEFAENAGFRPFTLDEYHQMISAGILLDGEPVELLEGWMIKKMSHGTPHDAILQALYKRLLRLAPDGWDVRGQSAITLPDDDSEPEPDFAVVRGDESTYRNRHPGPADIGIVVEVAHSSLRVDRVGKARIYARAGIAVYWVVNVAEKVIEVYTNPSGPTDAPAYAKRDDYAVGTTVPVVLDGNAVGAITVAEVFG